MCPLPEEWALSLQSFLKGTLDEIKTATTTKKKTLKILSSVQLFKDVQSILCRALELQQCPSGLRVKSAWESKTTVTLITAMFSIPTAHELICLPFLAMEVPLMLHTDSLDLCGSSGGPMLPGQPQLLGAVTPGGLAQNSYIRVDCVLYWVIIVYLSPTMYQIYINLVREIKY